MSAIILLGLFLAGVSLGGIYFGGLWFTLRRLKRWRQPFLGMGVSWLVRLVILLSGGAWLMKQAIAPPLLVILLLSAGMWLSRTVLIAWLLSTVERSVDQSVTTTAHPSYPASQELCP
jgi:F1F0 ATPase subunit 2